MALLLIGPAPVSAEVPIYVTCSIARSTLSAYLDAEQPNAERQVATWLATRLGKEFSYWDFQAATPGYPHLSIVVSPENHDWLLTLSMELQKGATPVPLPSRIRWTTDVELDRTGWPAPSDVPLRLQEALETQAINARHDELFSWLQKVPLGYDARVAPEGKLRVVLPLDWARNRQLALSQFKVMYRTAEGVASVFGRGLGMPFSYPEPPMAAVGILAKKFALGDSPLSDDAEDIAGHANDLPAWKPLQVFLIDFNPQGLTLPGDGASDPALSIASPQ